MVADEELFLQLAVLSPPLQGCRRALDGYFNFHVVTKLWEALGNRIITIMNCFTRAEEVVSITREST
jgi:hypothetical protein